MTTAMTLGPVSMEFVRLRIVINYALAGTILMAWVT